MKNRIVELNCDELSLVGTDVDALAEELGELQEAHYYVGHTSIDDLLNSRLHKIHGYAFKDNVEKERIKQTRAYKKWNHLLTNSED